MMLGMLEMTSTLLHCSGALPTAADNKLAPRHTAAAFVSPAAAIAPAAMSPNVALLRRSLCINQWLADRVALYGTGKGRKGAQLSALLFDSCCRRDRATSLPVCHSRRVDGWLLANSHRSHLTRPAVAAGWLAGRAALCCAVFGWSQDTSSCGLCPSVLVTSLDLELMGRSGWCWCIMRCHC